MDARLGSDREFTAPTSIRPSTASKVDRLTPSGAVDSSSPHACALGVASTPSGGDALADTVTLGRVAAHALDEAAPSTSTRASRVATDEPALSAQQAQALLGLPGATPAETLRWVEALPSERRLQTIEEISTDVSRSTAFTSLQSHALQDPQGAASFTSLMRSCAESPEQAAALVRVQAQAAATDHGRQAVIDTQAGLSHNVAAASATREVMTAAVETAEGREARNALFREAAGDPPLAAAVFSEAIPSSANGGNAHELTACLRDVSSDAQSAEAFTRLQTAALDDPNGREAVRASMCTQSTDPAVAQGAQAVEAPAAQAESGRPPVEAPLERAGGRAEMTEARTGVQTSAVSGPEGRDTATASRQATAGDPSLATAQVRVDAQAASTPSGQQALVERNHQVACDPLTAAAQVEIEHSAARTPEGRQALIRTYQAAAGNPALAFSRLQVEESAAALPQGAAVLEEVRQRSAEDPSLGGARKAWEAAVRSPAIAPSARPFSGVSAAAGGLGAYALSVAPARQLPPPQVDLVVDASTRIARVEGVAAVDLEADGGFLEAPPVAGRERVSALLRQAQGRPVDDARVEPTRREVGSVVDDDEDEMTVERLEVREVTPSHAVQRTSRLEPIEAVTMFDLSDARERSCTRCGETVENRAPGCPCCQEQLREKLVSSASTIQRSGYVIGQEVDTVEVTASARQHLEAADSVASMRKPMAFLQMRDVLALCSSRVTGYAVARAA